ncbi:MAG: elongation factor P maturation arginine rhamnosyltransferase EarP [Pseudomonadota bacterium]
MGSNITIAPAVALFCHVIDNYGDIGVCWRLARQLAAEHGLQVYILVDDLQIFRKICPAVDTTASVQHVDGVEIIAWGTTSVPARATDVSLVIEAFGCNLPNDFLEAFARRIPVPVWINLEYLSAESWVEDFHATASPHPLLPLTKHFYFPGFNDRTGGLIREAWLISRRDGFQRQLKANATRHCNNVNGGNASPQVRLLVSVFCYPNAPLLELFKAMENDISQVFCLIPEGVASEKVAAYLGTSARAGATKQVGNLTVEVIALTNQDDYDKLLWTCDLNFVRGEDSFVRAQWAARPAIWHIYAQPDDAHWPKLQAFLDRYVEAASATLQPLLQHLYHAWNGSGHIATAWKNWRTASFDTDASRWENHATVWASKLADDADLATRLLQYAKKLG